MIRKNTIIIILLAVSTNLINLSSTVFSQTVSPLVDIKIMCIVEVGTTRGVYTYSYRIFNPTTNSLSISMFDIDISKPSKASQLHSQGLVIVKRKDDSLGILITKTFDEEIERIASLLERSVIPVGIEVPSGWISGISIVGTVGWGSSEESEIKPGQLLNGFKIVSPGLPGIREIIVRPSYVVTEEEIFKMGVSEKEYIENTWQVLNKFYDSISFRTKTIGPTAPPADFKPIEYLDYIINLKHEASKLGWITNKGVENSLNAKLENARKKLEQGDIIAARNILNALINEVEAQGCRTYDDCPTGKHLTPEAYALLYYNTKYLIDNLKQTE